MSHWWVERCLGEQVFIISRGISVYNCNKYLCLLKLNKLNFEFRNFMLKHFRPHLITQGPKRYSDAGRRAGAQLWGGLKALSNLMGPLTSLWSEHTNKTSLKTLKDYFWIYCWALSTKNLSLRYVKVNSVFKFFGTKGNLSWQSTSIRLAAIEKITPINWQVFQSSRLRNLILISLILSEVE